MKLRFADLVLPASILITPIASSIITIYGRPTVVLDAFYNRVWQDDARSGLLAALICTFLLSIVLAVAAIRLRSENVIGSRLISQNYLISLLFAVLISVVANYTSWGIFGVAKVFIFFWVAYTFSSSGVTIKSFSTSSFLVLLSYISMAVFPLVSPSNSWKICRDDKCTVTGSLLTSYFQSENALSLYVLTTVYFLRFLEKRWHRVFGYLLALGLTYLSGSRLGVFVVVIVLILLISGKVKILFWAPPTLLALSAGFFVFGNGSDLTGRGSIFSAVREIWLSSPLFGVGPNATQLAFERGMVIGFIPYNEQTEVAHILAHYGSIAALLLLGIIFVLFRSRKKINRVASYFALVAPFLVTSLAFATESPVSFTIDCPSFWVVALLFAKISTLDKNEEDLESVFLDNQSANPYKRSPASPSPGTM